MWEDFNMSICFSEKKEGIVAIAGHVGCGHCHSLNNQVQDDSSGLSTAVSYTHLIPFDPNIIFYEYVK